MPDSSRSIAQHYHERTKYDPETISTKSQSLDWGNQPIPFKEYRIGTSLELSPYLPQKSEAVMDETYRFWQRLSRVLLCSYGLTVKIITMSGEPVYFRAAPSAGGLYPAELYLISRGTPILPAGLYNYQAKTHSLIRFWDSDVWLTLQEGCFWHPSLDQTQLALVTTGVFFRSAWRYQDRAYRRICLDTGHLLGNIELACAISDYRPHLIGGFVDDQINQLLYLDPTLEGATSVIALADLLDVNQNLPLFSTVRPSPTLTHYPAIADGELLFALHKATSIRADVAKEKTPVPPLTAKVEKPETVFDKYNFPFCLKVSTQSKPISWGENLLGLEETILKRRSTRTYSGGDLTFDELKLVLDFAYQPQHYFDQNLDRYPDYFDTGLIETFVVVSGIEGLEEGCYYYAPNAEELRQIRFKNFRRELHFLCLGQNLGRDAAAVVFHTADLQQAIAKYGDRAYRYLHMDAGHLGQRLNLAAIRVGIGVSGIAGFFDNEVNEVLGIPADEAVLYLTTLGRPG
jgi:SagB-type dehydrogenase family enzyme